MSARILVVGGVSAAGKTGAALALARRFDGELVGADSVQVYRGFDIGSAKPSAAELGGVPHHLIDVVDPDEEIDAARFATMADAVIAEIVARGRLPIVVGGTGLWLRALVRGLVAVPAVEPALREALEAEAERLGSPAMHARLAELDPLAASRIHANDRLRIVRALEVHAQTGRPLGELQREHALGAPRYDALGFALDLPREELHPRLMARLDAMLEAGWVDEVRGLLERWGPDVRPMQSVGYREVRAHALEGVSLEETRRLAYKATRIYTRRQRTWFRGDPSAPTWTTAAALLQPSSLERIERWLGSGWLGPG